MNRKEFLEIDKKINTAQSMIIALAVATTNSLTDTQIDINTVSQVLPVVQEHLEEVKNILAEVELET